MGGSIWNVYASYSPDGGLTWTASPGMDLSGNGAGMAAPPTDVASASIMADGASGDAAWAEFAGWLNQILVCELPISERITED